MKLSAVFDAVLLGTLVILVGCGGGGGQNSSNPQTLPAPTLTSMMITPSSAQITKGSAQQFTATGKYSDGSSKNLSSVNWSSSAIAVAGIGASGLARGLQTGTTVITGSTGSVHGSATLNVTAEPLISISLAPISPSLAAGTTLQLKAVGVYQDGSTQDLTGSVSWTSSAPSIASVNGSGLLSGIKKGTARVFASQGSVTGTANVSVTAATMVALAVTPGSASIAKQTTLQFSAIGTFTDGSTQDVTSLVTWTSAQISVATVSAGLASGVGAGGSTITATSGTLSASASLTVTNATVLSIAVSPGNPTIVAGLFQQFSASGSFSDGSTQNISGVVNWSSSAPTVATPNTAGLVFATTPGTATISATFETVTGSSVVTVQVPTLTSISVTPSSPVIANTTTQNFFVTGYYNDGSTQTLTSATWSSSNTAVATLSGNVAFSKQPGTTVITGVVGSFTASTTLTVTSATLVSITVTPANSTVALGTAKNYFAIGTFSDGSTQGITNLASWASSNTAVATMQGSLATATGSGSANISASFDSVTGSTGLTVSQATLTSLAVTPASPVLVIGAKQQFAATGTFSDGSKQDLTSVVTWNSSQPTVASIGSSGIAAGLSGGTSTISAQFGSIVSSTSLTVSSATLVSLAINPQSAAVPPGITFQFSATGTYSDGTTQKVTGAAHWSSSDSTVATIGNSGSAGQLTGVSTGWTRISAQLNSIAASAVVNVSNATLVSITISPANPTVTLGTGIQLNATGTFSDGSTQDISQWVVWNSSNAQVCIVNSSGFLIPNGSGTATVTANFSSVSSETAVTVY